MICTYVLNCLLVCRTCVMFLSDYSVFRLNESLCWIVSNNYSETNNLRLGIF